MNNSAIFGILILFGAIAILIIYMYGKREKNYKIAMEKYERDMEAYNKAVEMYGEPSAAVTSQVPPTRPAPVVSYPTTVVSHSTPVASPAVSAAEGEVLLSGVDDNTAAMVIAILCDELGKNPGSLRFHSITAL